MVGLLDLPSELLFNIIDLVLSPAVLPENGGTRRRLHSKSSVQRALYCVPILDYSKTSGVVSLLLLNQRMYSETREYITKAPRNFKVDIAVVNDHWFWPTRRTVPVRKLDGIIDKLDITIIPCCTAEERHLQTNWDHDKVHPEDSSTFRRRLARELMTPLTRFLLNGNLIKHISDVFRGLETWVHPLSDEQLDDGRNIPVTRVDTVTISVDTSSYGNGNEALSLNDVPFRKIEGLAHLDFEQLYPVDFAKSESYLHELGGYIDEWVSENYGIEGVAERMGKIQFFINGKMWKELDANRVTDIRGTA